MRYFLKILGLSFAFLKLIWVSILFFKKKEIHEIKKPSIKKTKFQERLDEVIKKHKENENIR